MTTIINVAVLTVRVTQEQKKKVLELLGFEDPQLRNGIKQVRLDAK